MTTATALGEDMQFTELANAVCDAWKAKLERLYTPGNGFKSECLTSLVGESFSFSPKNKFLAIGALHADVPNSLIIAKIFLASTAGKCAEAFVMKEAVSDLLYIDLETMWVYGSMELCGDRRGLIYPTFRRTKKFYVEDSYLISVFYDRFAKLSH